jgi:predicted RNase H-like HicB family nuclease
MNPTSLARGSLANGLAAEACLEEPLAGVRSREEIGMNTRRLTALITREEDAYVALCPELDVASQGETVEGARLNLTEAVELFLETADRAEISSRLSGEVFVTSLEVAFA